jgi:ketosteroid isomerase-like protein
MTEENEKHVRAFYKAVAPGHRECLWSLQAPDVVYDLPEGMPVGAGRFEGLLDVTERFLASFYQALDAAFVAEEFIAAGEHVVAIGRIEGTTLNAAVPVDVPFVHLDGPRRTSSTIARFYRHSSASAGAGRALNRV